MSAICKLLIIIGLNFTALALIIYRLIKDGNEYPAALRITWDWVFFRDGTNLPVNPGPIVFWILFLGKTWWLMLLISGITWVNSRQLVFLPVIILLILAHVYWYLRGRAYQRQRFDRILNLNQNWGVIYKEISDVSGVNSKTLAELDLRKKNLLVLAIERQGRITPFPKGLEVLNTGDRMIMFGDLYSFRSFFEDGDELKPVAPGANT
jgi:hypothetical protein